MHALVRDMPCLQAYNVMYHMSCTTWHNRHERYSECYNIENCTKTMNTVMYACSTVQYSMYSYYYAKKGT